VTLSFGNIMLIARQKPDATNVAGLRTWNSLGRFVKRGEKGIFILAPMIGKKRNEEEATADTDNKSNGEARLYGFRAVYVFDRSSRDLWPSLCAPDAIHEWHFRRSPDSSRYIIAQLLCSMQRSLMQGSSYLHLLPTNPGF
jgi:hypothetical protein